MPLYSFICDHCQTTMDVVYPMHRQGVPRCSCGASMRKDYAAQKIVARGDEDFGSSDYDKWQHQAATGDQCSSVACSKSLARVPGVQKIRGRDGKPLAVFRNRQDRRRACQRAGLPTD